SITEVLIMLLILIAYSETTQIYTLSLHDALPIYKAVSKGEGKMVKELNIPSRILMGPGPSDVDPRVLKAMATPMIGHMDPKFMRSEEHTSELQSRFDLVCRLLLEKNKIHDQQLYV